MCHRDSMVTRSSSRLPSSFGLPRAMAPRFFGKPCLNFDNYIRVPHDTSYFYLIRTLRSICSNAGAIRPKSLSGEMKIRYRKELSRPCRVTSQSRSLMEPFCPCTGESPTRYTDLPGTRFIRTSLASPSTRKPGFDRRKESSKSRVV